MISYSVLFSFAYLSAALNICTAAPADSTEKVNLVDCRSQVNFGDNGVNNGIGGSSNIVIGPINYGLDHLLQLAGYGGGLGGRIGGSLPGNGAMNNGGLNNGAMNSGGLNNGAMNIGGVNKGVNGVNNGIGGTLNTVIGGINYG